MYVSYGESYSNPNFVANPTEFKLAASQLIVLFPFIHSKINFEAKMVAIPFLRKLSCTLTFTSIPSLYIIFDEATPIMSLS